MDQHGASERGGELGGRCTRREALAGGGLFLGSLLLAGCSGGSKASALPNTYWSDPGPFASVAEPPTSTIPTGPRTPTSFPPEFTPTPGIVPRSAWARYDIARPREIFPMNGVRRITVHHDGMPRVALGSSRQVAARIEQIRQAHVSGRGWADLGYHYVIDPTGRVWEGRSTRWQGAHVKDQNENNLGILVLGNFDVQAPTAAALASLDKFLANQMQRYSVPMGAVRTHMERAPTECPGRALQAYMARTRSGAGNLYAMASRVGLGRG